MEFENYPKFLVLYYNDYKPDIKKNRKNMRDLKTTQKDILCDNPVNDILLIFYLTVLKNDFDEFTSLVLIIYRTDEYYEGEHYDRLVKTYLRYHKKLRYKSKLLIYVGQEILGKENRIKYGEWSYNKRQDDFEKSIPESVDWPRAKWSSVLDESYYKVDNLIIWFLMDLPDYYEQIDFIISYLIKLSKKPIQAIFPYIAKRDEYNESYDDIVSTTTEGCYVLSINPALAIIFNQHKYNENNLTDRIGSHLDTDRIQSYFRKKRIPLAFKEDATANEVRYIMKSLKYCDLSIFKTIVIFIMGHGIGTDEIIRTNASGDYSIENDIIKTNDGDFYSIQNDIVKPFLENEYLKRANTNLIVFFNACRGNYDPLYACVEDKVPKFKTDVKNIDPRVTILYSTQPGWISIRDRNKGSIFIQIVFDYLDNLTKNLIITEMVRRIRKPITKKSQCTDYAVDVVIHPKSASNHILEIIYSWNNELAQSLDVVRDHFENCLTLQ